MVDKFLRRRGKGHIFAGNNIGLALQGKIRDGDTEHIALVLLLLNLACGQSSYSQIVFNRLNYKIDCGNLYIRIEAEPALGEKGGYEAVGGRAGGG